MLTEDQVVQNTCAWLETQDCQINSFCLGNARGDDIVATLPNRETLLVECKGAKSPRSGTAFSGHYAWSMSAGALFNTIRAIEQNPNTIFALALPSVESYRSLFESLRSFCERNRIYVFWLTEAGVVEVWQQECNKRFQVTCANERHSTTTIRS